MGKAALFYVTAASLMLLGLYGDTTQSKMASARTEARYYEQVLSREVAQSAFNVLVARTRADFAGHRPNRSAVPYRGGEFSYSATGAAAGPVLLEATGEVGSAIHRISGVLLSDAEARFAALTIDGPVEEIEPHGAAWIVSGVDTEPPGSTATGSGVSGPGVRSVLDATDVIAQDEMPAAQVVGASGLGHFESGAGGIDFVALANEIADSDAAVVLTGDQRWRGNQSYGSRESPAVMVIDGDLTVTGNVTFYGALLVRGNFDMAAGTPRWEGLVIVQAQGGSHSIRGNTSFYGALVLQSLTADGEAGGEADAGMVGGHFDVSVLDGLTGSALYQAHQYDDRFDTGGIDLLQPGCGIEGGLCWEESVTGAGSVTISVLNGASMAGSVYLETDNTIIDTDISDFAPITLDPSDLRALRFAFGGVCSLPGAGPSAVSSDTATRAGAFTVRISDATSGSVLHDVSVYHHLEGSICTASGGGSPGSFVQVSPMSVDIRGNPTIRTSSSALRRLSTVIPGAEPGHPRLLLREVRERGETLRY